MLGFFCALISVTTGLTPPVSSPANKPSVSGPTVVGHLESEAGAIFEEVGYKPLATKDSFVLAAGTDYEWEELCSLEDVEMYNERDPSEGIHAVVGYFARTIDEAGLADTLRALANWRDANYEEALACAFISSPDEQVDLDDLPGPVKRAADDAGIVVFYGDHLGLVVDLAVQIAQINAKQARNDALQAQHDALQAQNDALRLELKKLNALPAAKEAEHAAPPKERNALPT